MTTKNYTYKDAVKANRRAKRGIREGYLFHEDFDDRMASAKCFAYSDENGENLYIRTGYIGALSPFLCGAFCTRKKGEDFIDYLEKIHFELSVATTPEERKILEDLASEEGKNQFSKILVVHPVNDQGIPMGAYYFINNRTRTHSSPEEALRNAGRE